MRIAERYLGLPGGIDIGYEDIYTVTSVGVLIHLYNLRAKDNPYRIRPQILLVEQLDQEGLPWGIPAGHIEPFEEFPTQTAIREVKEETGLEIDLSKLHLWTINSPIGKPLVARPLYSYKVTWKELESLGNWHRLSTPEEYFHDRYILDVEEKKTEEVGRLVLVDCQDCFHRCTPDPEISPLYRQDIWWPAVNRILESLWTI